MKRLAVALAAIAMLVGVVRAGDVTGLASRLHHISFGRTQFVSINGSTCQPLPTPSTWIRSPATWRLAA